MVGKKEEVENLAAEVELMRDLRHTNIVSCIGALVSDLHKQNDATMGAVTCSQLYIYYRMDRCTFAAHICLNLCVYV